MSVATKPLAEAVSDAVRQLPYTAELACAEPSYLYMFIESGRLRDVVYPKSKPPTRKELSLSPRGPMPSSPPLDDDTHAPSPPLDGDTLVSYGPLPSSPRYDSDSDLPSSPPLDSDSDLPSSPPLDSDSEFDEGESGADSDSEDEDEEAILAELDDVEAMASQKRSASSERAESKRVRSDDSSDESSESDSDHAYMDEWDSDDSNNDDSEDASQSDSDSNESSGPAPDSDDEMVVDLGDDIGVDSACVPTMFVSARDALLSALSATTRRRQGLTGLLIKYRQDTAPLRLRLCTGLKAQIDETEVEIAAAAESDDEFSSAPAHKPDRARAPPAEEDDESAAENAYADEDAVVGEKAYTIDELIPDENESGATTLPQYDAIRAGTPQTQAFPVHSRMCLRVARTAHGNPIWSMPEFAELYSEDKDACDGWVDVDGAGFACIRTDWALLSYCLRRDDVKVFSCDDIKKFLLQCDTNPLTGDLCIPSEEKINLFQHLSDITN